MPLLTTYIEKFQDIRVLVIGDIMLDRFMYGKVGADFSGSPGTGI